MSNARTMLYRIVDGVFVVMHASEPPHDEEWVQHCQDVARELAKIRGVLVYSNGGAPTSKQRGLLRSTLQDSPVPTTAVLTSSAIVRGIVTSINWFLNNRLAAFDPNELQRALEHIAGDGAPLPTENIASALHLLGKELSVAVPSTWRR